VDVTARSAGPRALNAACGIRHQVRIVDGTARPPFPDASFDRAIPTGADEHCRQGRRLSEACRVLKPGGGWSCSSGMRTERSAEFPVSWATLEEALLATDADTHRDLTAAGFAGVVARCDPGGFAANRPAPQGEVEDRRRSACRC
jgi:hypothetical protein